MVVRIETGKEIVMTFFLPSKMDYGDSLGEKFN
jgi:hypothetical protein